MAATWKTVRVFISSTFRDMHAERDHLVRVVFPELRERCNKRHLHLVDVDLRWGVTEEDAQRGKALEICLREIEDCRPFFVGLLGERYGWIPPQYDIPDEEQFDTLRNVERGHSITAMEIYHGVLNNPQMRSHAFFCFRDPAFIDTLPPQKQPDFRAEDDEHAEKLRKLKDRVRASGLPVRENYRYDDLEAWGQQMLEDLWEAIKVEYPDPATLPEPDPLDAERAYHDFFIETRTELFVGQRHLLARLHEFASGDTPGPMVVSGTPGCGKSALLARFVSQFRRLEPEAFVLYHFVGASPGSTDPRQMLRRLCGELARRFGLEEEIPQDYAELRVKFWQFCQRAAQQARVLLVLDALNQLDEAHRAHDLDWLPALVPPGLRVILSSLEGDTLAAARQKYPQHQDMIVTSLRLVDQGFIIARQLQQARKRLTTARKYRQGRAVRVARGEEVPPEPDRSQLRYILTGVYTRQQTPTPEQTIQRETANPLYLKLVAEELRLFGDYDRLPEFIARLPIDMPGMFLAVLDRLEQDNGRELVEHSLSLIATGRHGLLEGEVLELLTHPGEERFPMALWSRLYRGLAAYLKPRASASGGDEGLIDFFHQQLAKVVHGRYLATDDAQLSRHAELAKYFRRKGDPSGDGLWRGNYPRGLAELPFHLARADRTGEVLSLLCTIPYLHARCCHCDVYDLLQDYSIVPEEEHGKLHAWQTFIGCHSQRLTWHPKSLFALVHHEGFPGAKEQAAELLACGRWREPWLSTEIVWLPEPQSDSARPAVSLLRQFRFESPRAAIGLAQIRHIAFVAERIGQIALVDIQRRSQQPTFVTTRDSRVLALSVTPDATYLVAAYEDVTADLIELTYALDGHLSSQALRATFSYLLPDCDPPAFLWETRRLWYQSRRESLMCHDPSDASRPTLDVALDSRHHGELACGIPLADDMILAIRRSAGGCVLVFRGRKVVGSLDFPGTNVACLCEYEDHRIAVGLEDHRVVVLNPSKHMQVVDSTSTREAPACIVCQSGTLVWLSDRGKVMRWRPGHARAETIDDGESVFRHDQQLGLPGIAAAGNDHLVVATQWQVASFRVDEDGKGGGSPWRGLFQRTPQHSFAVHKRADSFWLLDLHAQKAQPILPDDDQRPEFAVDGHSHLLAAQALGNGLFLDIPSGRKQPVTLPAAPSCVCGDPSGGFWLGDRYGELHFVSGDHAQTVGALPGSGTVLRLRDDLLWCGVAPKESNSLWCMLFFHVKITQPPALRALGKRFFPKDYGTLCAISYDRPQDRVVAFFQGSRCVVKTGSPTDFLRERERDHVIGGLRGAIRQVVATPDDGGLYVLSNEGSIVRLSLDALVVEASLLPSIPFRLMATDIIAGERVLLADGANHLYYCHLER